MRSPFMHQLLMRHGGAAALRDEGLLESALARPRQHFRLCVCRIFCMAAAYVAGIVKNHPFVDGNKRTGFMYRLRISGIAMACDFTASEAEAAQAVLELAAGTIDETGFALFLRDHVKRVRKRAK